MSRADLFHALAELCGEYGSDLVLTSLYEAAESAADHETGTSAARPWKAATKSLHEAQLWVEEAEAEGVSLDQALTVLAEFSESLEHKVTS